MLRSCLRPSRSDMLILLAAILVPVCGGPSYAADMYVDYVRVYQRKK
jgi:hypothetical protein